MTEEPEVPTENKSPESASPVKAEPDMKKDRKKKERALKEFLAKPEGEAIDLPTRRAEENEAARESQAEGGRCKICGELSQKRKQCEFCKDVVCLEHLRKKRKYKNTPKFLRICDDCEDSYLYDKYMKFETKAEEAIAMQEMIIQTKRDELAELAQAKQTRLQLLRNKQNELEQQRKENESKVRVADNDYANKLRRFEAKQAEISELQTEIGKLEESLPRPLDDDYNMLLEQNNKITKELVKFEKQCAEALKAKSTREKELYEAYYNWEKKEAVRANTKKNEQCAIY